MIRVSNIKLPIAKAESLTQENANLEEQLKKRLKIKEEDILDLKIFKKSIDARDKEALTYVYTVDVSVAASEEVLLTKGRIKDSQLSIAPQLHYQSVQQGTEKLSQRPVIIGMGPAGLFAGLLLARDGYNPIILERGDDVDARELKINKFWSRRLLDIESNVQFGEGGAGTFSDGKLTTLINDKRCYFVLEEFIKAGAPPEILYKNKPHIGTDKLRGIVKRMRQEIIASGGEVRFRAKVTDFIIEKGTITGLTINEKEHLACDIVLLGIGHSARDTFEMLYRRGVIIKPKPFSLGVRIEHPQKIINKAQYGSFDSYPGLGAADYKLSFHSDKRRSAYTFCMCPGGYVVAAASEAEGVVTNGMSEYSRNNKNANAAILVGVTPEDFESDHPLSGIEFQRKWEKLAFELGGGHYQAPIQLTGDFLADKPSTSLGSVKPSYLPGVKLAELKYCLPAYVTETLKEAIIYFNHKIKDFALPDSILTAVESRSSSPVRITRDDNHLSNIQGIYPMGEGAGYAGGIMSSAVDGVKTAEKIIERYKPAISFSPY